MMGISGEIKFISYTDLLRRFISCKKFFLSNSIGTILFLNQEKQRVIKSGANHVIEAFPARVRHRVGIRYVRQVIRNGISC